MEEMEERRLCTCLLSSGLAVNEVEVEGRGGEGGGVGQSFVVSLLIIAFLWKVKPQLVTFPLR